MDTDSDVQQLLHAARRGDCDALGRLLELYRGYLKLLTRVQLDRQMQRKFDGSDVVQEAFLQAQVAFGQFRGTTEAELLSWLRQILSTRLANLIRKYRKTEKRNAFLERDLGQYLDQSSRQLDRGLISPQSSPSQRAERRELSVVVADSLDRLPAHYREVIIMHHLEEHSLAEVARQLDRTLGSVEKIWVRALASLRKPLGGHQ